MWVWMQLYFAFLGEKFWTKIFPQPKILQVGSCLFLNATPVGFYTKLKKVEKFKLM